MTLEHLLGRRVVLDAAAPHADLLDAAARRERRAFTLSAVDGALWQRVCALGHLDPTELARELARDRLFDAAAQLVKLLSPATLTELAEAARPDSPFVFRSVLRLLELGAVGDALRLTDRLTRAETLVAVVRAAPRDEAVTAGLVERALVDARSALDAARVEALCALVPFVPAGAREALLAECEAAVSRLTPAQVDAGENPWEWLARAALAVGRLEDARRALERAAAEVSAGRWDHLSDVDAALVCASELDASHALRLEWAERALTSLEAAGEGSWPELVADLLDRVAALAPSLAERVRAARPVLVDAPEAPAVASAANLSPQALLDAPEASLVSPQARLDATEPSTRVASPNAANELDDPHEELRGGLDATEPSALAPATRVASPNAANELDDPLEELRGVLDDARARWLEKTTAAVRAALRDETAPHATQTAEPAVAEPAARDEFARWLSSTIVPTTDGWVRSVDGAHLDFSVQVRMRPALSLTEVEALLAHVCPQRSRRASLLYLVEHAARLQARAGNLDAMRAHVADIAGYTTTPALQFSIASELPPAQGEQELLRAFDAARPATPAPLEACWPLRGLLFETRWAPTHLRRVALGAVERLPWLPLRLEALGALLLGPDDVVRRETLRRAADDMASLTPGEAAALPVSDETAAALCALEVPRAAACFVALTSADPPWLCWPLAVRAFGRDAVAAWRSLP